MLTADAVSLAFDDATVLRTTGAGELSGIRTVVGGTGSYAGAAGVIQPDGEPRLRIGDGDTRELAHVSVAVSAIRLASAGS